MERIVWPDRVRRSGRVAKRHETTPFAFNMPKILYFATGADVGNDPAKVLRDDYDKDL